MNYDSAGLMAQIQALIAAPTSSRSRTNNNKHPYFKRPGRGHNHDTCDACHEAGDLLCCDTCSASFHLMCVNPPLDYEQIPAGDWRCHRCLSTQGDSTGEGESGKKFPPISRRPGKKRTAPPPTKEPPSKKPALTSKLNKRITAKGGKVVATFFTQAVELARKLNPEQFVLPKYLMEYGASQFPGAPRPPAKKGASKANKQIIETENGMVPSPIVICFICDVSCRRSPIIKCDACSASFHFECLNPPLTGVPQGRWLCHLHPEPTLEHKTLKSLSFTERVRLYDYAKQPIDPVQVALKFVTKTQRAKYSYFRSKVKIKGKELTQVPGPVVDCYANEENESDLPEWPTFNQLPMYNIWNNTTRVDRTDGGMTSVSPLDLLAQVAANELRGNGDDPKTSNTNSLSNGMHRDRTSTKITEPKSLDDECRTESVANSKIDMNMEKAFEALKEKSKSHEGGILDGLDLDTVLLLAAQKMRELICNETIESSSKENNQPTTQVGISKSSNHFYDDRAPSIGVKPVGKEVETDDTTIPTRTSNSEEIYQSENDVDGKIEKLGSSKDAAVEISVPYIKLLIINQQKEIMFKEGEIMIGKGHVALDLTEYVPCPSVTEEHCCIYYDYVGSRWELINYSPNGTVVNKVLYGCEPITKNSKNISFMDNFHGVKPVPRVAEPNHVIKDENLELSSGCHCRLNQRLQPRESLEMSAYLEIGSRIQVGCIRIMVVDIGCESKLVPRQWLVYNGVSQVPLLKKEVSLEPGKKRYQKLTSARSEPGSDDDRENSDSDDVSRTAPIKTPKERRKSITRTTIPSRGGTRGRGRGRGRGSLAARRRAESVQNNKELPIKKFSNRGRKRKIPISEPLVVVQSNGTGNPENSIKKEISLEMDDAIGDHDYGVPTSNRKVQLPESTKQEIKQEPRSGDEISQKKSPGVSG
ncbi:unnamed protein product [Allacma fusca]|uniref:PHD finger protein 12 n=1 Tax=Allacma fusca TaxID=39272 RepID=A0A8J2J1M9_9HEXA|nr:unnamed protein product [Allacma fusca]